MKTIVCPRCFTKHSEENLAWGCASSDCPREGIPTTTDMKNPVCASCSNPLTLRYCPECGFNIIVGPDATESYPISIVGSESAGKSNYLTVLINEIRHSIGRAYNCSLFPIGGDDTILQYENFYYKPLYEEGKCIPSTNQEDVRPLVYSLVFDSDAVGETCTLTFYDACGANFRNERVMSDYNRSVYNSRGIIFLVDPSQLPGIREEYVAEGRPVLPDDLSSLLSRTIQLIRAGSDQKSLKRKIQIPIAICLSKLDTVRDRLDASSYYNYHSRNLNQPAFDNLDNYTTDLEMEALIDYWAGTDLINQVKSQFEHYSFFGFSALGSAPDENNIVTHIAPFRVCDPFLWILSQNKVIKSANHTIKRK